MAAGPDAPLTQIEPKIVRARIKRQRAAGGLSKSHGAEVTRPSGKHGQSFACRWKPSTTATSRVSKRHRPEDHDRP